MSLTFLWRWERFVFFGSFWYVMQNYDDGFLKLLNVTHTDIMLIYSLFSYFQSDRLRRSDRYKASRRNSNQLLGKSWILYAEDELKIVLYYTRFNLLMVCVYVHLKEIFCLDFAYESFKEDESWQIHHTVARKWIWRLNANLKHKVMWESLHNTSTSSLLYFLKSLGPSIIRCVSTNLIYA